MCVYRHLASQKVRRDSFFSVAFLEFLQCLFIFKACFFCCLYRSLPTLIAYAHGHVQATRTSASCQQHGILLNFLEQRNASFLHRSFQKRVARSLWYEEKLVVVRCPLTPFCAKACTRHGLRLTPSIAITPTVSTIEGITRMYVSRVFLYHLACTNTLWP